MPRYDYECDTCGKCFEETRSVVDRHDVVCESCGCNVSIVIGCVGVIAYSYYNDALGSEITGPQQKRALLKEKGLIDIGDTPPSKLKIETPNQKLERELASPEFEKKFGETYQDVVGCR